MAMTRPLSKPVTTLPPTSIGDVEPRIVSAGVDWSSDQRSEPSNADRAVSLLSTVCTTT